MKPIQIHLKCVVRQTFSNIDVSEMWMLQVQKYTSWNQKQWAAFKGDCRRMWLFPAYCIDSKITLSYTCIYNYYESVGPIVEVTLALWNKSALSYILV